MVYYWVCKQSDHTSESELVVLYTLALNLPLLTGKNITFVNQALVVVLVQIIHSLILMEPIIQGPSLLVVYIVIVSSLFSGWYIWTAHWRTICSYGIRRIPRIPYPLHYINCILYNTSAKITLLATITYLDVHPIRNLYIISSTLGTNN